MRMCRESTIESRIQEGSMRVRSALEVISSYELVGFPNISAKGEEGSCKSSNAEASGKTMNPLRRHEIKLVLSEVSVRSM